MGNGMNGSMFAAVAPGYTNGLYLPAKPLEQWDLEECARALCKKSGGKVTGCMECENKCKYGRRIEEILTATAAVEEKKMRKHEFSAEARRKGAEANKRKSEIAHLRAIASGNPKAYFQTHGVNIGNGIKRLRAKYSDVTQEEAQKRLAEMGADVEEAQGMPCIHTETPAEPLTDANTDKICRNVERLQAPVKMPIRADLQIYSAFGKWFDYKRADGGGMCVMQVTQVHVCTVEDVEEICAEIKAAFEMMGGIKE